MPFRLRLSPAVYDALVNQALEERPNECCGLLAGVLDDEAGGRIGRVSERYPLANEAGSPREYVSDARDLLRAFRDMRERGLELLAIYHSHPTSDPVPSRTDLERNYYPGVMQLIVSLKGPDPLLRAWWLAEKDFQEAEWECRD
jgi:proteasome lid subunit RPN8/RPN11